MFKMALYQNHVILVQWYNWYKKVQLNSECGPKGRSRVPPTFVHGS